MQSQLEAMEETVLMRLEELKEEWIGRING
jgi:hypothetical protein